MKQKIVMSLAALAGALILATLVAASLWPVINVVETGKTPEYPEVQPHYYTAEPQRVFDEALLGAKAMPRWQVTSGDLPTRTIKAEVTTKLMSFTDDVTIQVEPVTEFVTRVHVRSASRVGKGDFGQNARTIRAFLAELDRRLGAVKFDPSAERAKKEGKD